jgi:hypothetical protein
VGNGKRSGVHCGQWFKHSEGSFWAMGKVQGAHYVQSPNINNLLSLQDRETFRRIVLKNAYNKRKMYENLIDNVPMLKTLDVSHK